MENDERHGKIKLFLETWKKDYDFKTMASSVISISVTMLFALYNGFLGICLLSKWHGSICVFYLLLTAIRGMILLAEQRNLTRNKCDRAHYRHKTAIISSIMLIVLNLALILPISLMVKFEKPVNIGLIPAITMAAYTTYKLTMASVHIRKQRRIRQNNVLISELRTINFIDALVSVLTLQNTLIMVKQAESSVNDMIILSAVSSAAIYIVIIFTTIRLLVKELRI